MNGRSAVLSPVFVALACLVAGGLIGCDSPDPPSRTPDSVVPSLAHERQGLHLVVGDTVPISLDTGGTIRLEPWASDTLRPGAQIESDSSRLVMVLGDSAIVALDTGSATIRGTTPRAPGVRHSVRIEVISRQRAANETAVAVCPNEDGKAVRDMLAEQPMSKNADPIHEFNDCQRLIDGQEYRDLMGLFVERELEKLNNPAQFRDAPLVATVYDMTGSGGVGYSRLGIGTGKSCLYLRYRTVSGWKAALVQETTLRRLIKRTGPTTCENTSGEDLPPEQWNRLVVKPMTGVDFKGRSIAPPAARWDWDPVNKYNYIGVKCSIDQWCEIGKAGEFTPSGTIMISTPAGQKAVIKGYYDEQYLADAKGKKPTTVFGTIKPGSAIADPNEMDHDQPQNTYRVADIELVEKGGAQSEDFRRYVGLYTGQLPAAGQLTSHTALELTPDPGGSVGPKKAYKGRLNGKDLPDDAIHYFQHPGRPRFGIARWRWLPDDESTWSYCDPDGCCDTRRLLDVGS